MTFEKILPVLDIHAHLGGYGRQAIPDEGSPETLVKMMDRVGFTASFVSHMAGVMGQTYIGNKLAAEACAEYPGRLLAYLVFNPNAPEKSVTREVESFVNCPGVVGLKFHSTIHGAHANDKRYGPAYELAEKYKLPILMHTWGAADVTAVDAVCAARPNITVIAGHSGGNVWSDITACCDAALRRENLYLDLCLSLYREGQLEYMVKKVSADKIVFGSDASFFCSLPGYARVIFARIHDEDKRKILYDNTKKIFEL